LKKRFKKKKKLNLKEK